MLHRSTQTIYAAIFLVIAAAHSLAQNEATAEYSVTFTGNWTTASTPDGVVSSAHFTTLAIATHNSSVVFWESGGTASAGMEQLAELGATSTFLSEVRASSHSDVATTSTVGPGGRGTSTFTITVKRTHPLFTFASMIGPSPDWFVGLNGRSLLDESDQWRSSLTVDLYAYDAGTEDGTEFSLSNPATVPQGVITSLRNVGKFSDVRMARIAFTRQNVPPPPTSTPYITEIKRPNGAPEFTNADQVEWLVSFSEQVRNVSTDDFEVHGTSARVVSTTLVDANNSQYRITLRGGDLADLNGTVSLGLSSQQNIQNHSGIGLSTTLPTTNESYQIDNIAPTITSISPESVIGAPFIVDIEFSEDLAIGTFGDEGDVSSSEATVTAPVQRGSVYEITVIPNDPSKRATITLTVDAAAATDLAGNFSEAFSGQVLYEPRSNGSGDPAVVVRVASITPDGTYEEGDTIEILVVFSKPVTVIGSPVLNLQFDAGVRRARFMTGSGTDTLSFAYTIQPGDKTQDLDYVDTNALDTSRARVVDLTGRNANVVLPVPGSEGSLSQTSDIIVEDTTTVDDKVPSFESAQIQDLAFRMGTAIQVIQLPSATGGDGALKYSISPDLPTGLMIDYELRTLSGTPVNSLPRTEFTWTATDEDGDSDSLKFFIMVSTDLRPVFPADVSVSNKVYIEDSPIESFTLPFATGGDGKLSYQITPELPRGLSVDGDNNEISGIPLEPQSATEYNWRAEDEDGDVAVLEFSITVLADLQPEFDDEIAVSDQEFIEDSPIVPFSLPFATGGNGNLTYSLSPELPVGLTLDERSHTVSGTPKDATETTTYMWQVTDADGDDAEIVFLLTILADLQPTFGDDVEVADMEFIQYSPIDPFTLPMAMSGNGELSHSLYPELPEGLVLDMGSYVVSGTPEKPMPVTMFTWKVVDVDGDEDVVQFGLTVVEDLHPTFTLVELDRTYLQNDPIEPLQLPAAEGGNGTLSYLLTPDLPAGLILDAMTRTISGVPSEWQHRTEYQWTTTDQDGDTASVLVSITVIEDLMPSFAESTQIAEQMFITGSIIDPVILPSAEGGNGILRYKLEPELPLGLTLDIEAREITGTPTTPLRRTKFHWIVSDADDDTSTIQFYVTVDQDRQPEFRTGIADQRFTIETVIEPLTLPSADGGNGELSYALTPALPSGLVLDGDTHEISGTPSELLSPTSYRWSVEDIDGDSAEITFSIEVLPMPPMIVGSIGPRLLYVGGSSDTIDARGVVRGVISSWTFEDEGDNVVVALTTPQPGQVILRPLMEGTTSISVTASNVAGSANFSFSVTVATDSVEDTQIDFALAQSGQALLSSAMSVFERRFLVRPNGSSDSNGDSQLGVSSKAPVWMNETCSLCEKGSDLKQSLLFLSGLSWSTISDWQLESLRSDFFHGTQKWSVWGSLDSQNHSSGSNGNQIDGSLMSQYIGADWRLGDNLFAGAALSRHTSEAEYDFNSESAAGQGTLNLSLNGIYPYIQAKNGSNFAFYLVGGAGNGEAKLNRAHSSSQENLSDAEMNLFAGGFEYLAFQAIGVDVTIIGNAGTTTLSLADDSGLLTNRETSSGKLSLGGDVSLVRDLEEGMLVSSVGLRALNESGDGETGTGFEAVGSVGYWGTSVDFFVSGKVVAAHSGNDVSRNSLTARIRYKASTDGTGLGMSIMPRLGLDEKQKIGRLGRGFGISDLRQDHLPISAPSIQSEISYGMLFGDQSILVTPGISYQQRGDKLEQTTLNVRILPGRRTLTEFIWDVSVQGIRREKNDIGLGLTVNLDIPL